MNLERLKDDLDLALDVLAMLVFNIGYKLRSQRVMDLNLHIPSADDLIERR